MGLILDSSVLIAGERVGHNARQVLAEIAGRAAGEDVALSVVTLLELAHGAASAASPGRSGQRRVFLEALISAVPVHPVTLAVALRAGQTDGENAAGGARAALADLLIGVTALEPGYGVATRNQRHIAMIPGLQVVTF